MSVIQVRIITDGENQLDKYMLTDIFHLGNLKFTQRNETRGAWYKDKSYNYELVQDYFYPLKNDEILCEYIIDAPNGDGFVIYLNDDEKPRSYARCIEWFEMLQESHIELIHEMNWKIHVYIANNPQRWISKGFLKHINRFKIRYL